MAISSRDIIRRSLMLLGVLGTGEVSEASEQSDAFQSFKNLLDSWSTEGLLSFNRVTETFPLTGGKTSYTIGTGGDFNTSRPQSVDRAATLISTGAFPFEQQLEILNTDQYSKIKVKSMTSTLATKFYLDNTYPLATIYLWPIPTDANSLVITSRKPIAEPLTVSSTVDFPPGYLRAFEYNLAIELAPFYGKAVSQEIAMAAEESKSGLKRQNSEVVLMHTDAPGSSSGGFNVLIGE